MQLGFKFIGAVAGLVDAPHDVSHELLAGLIGLLGRGDLLGRGGVRQLSHDKGVGDALVLAGLLGGSVTGAVCNQVRQCRPDQRCGHDEGGCGRHCKIATVFHGSSSLLLTGAAQHRCPSGW